MKDDYKITGQLKSDYNVEIETEGRYKQAYEVFCNTVKTRPLICYLYNIHQNFFSLPQYIVADVGYGSEQNYDDILNNRNRIPLITYNQYRKEKKKKFKNDPYQVANWEYNQNKDIYISPNGQTIHYSHLSTRTDKYVLTRTYKVYDKKDCSSCLLHAYCKRTKENNMLIYYNEKWEKQKPFNRDILSNETTGEI